MFYGYVKNKKSEEENSCENRVRCVSESRVRWLLALPYQRHPPTVEISRPPDHLSKTFKLPTRSIGVTSRGLLNLRCITIATLAYRKYGSAAITHTEPGRRTTQRKVECDNETNQKNI